MDRAIVERARSLFDPLGDQGGWAATFGRELNATDDRVHFQRAGVGLPIVEGRNVTPFHVNLAATRFGVTAEDARRLLPSGAATRRRLAYRDIASATNRLTLIAAILPRGSVSTHTVFVLKTPLTLRDQHFLCALFNSFVVNYLVRTRVTTHVTTEIVERVPVPRREQAGRAFNDLAAISRWMSRTGAGPALAATEPRAAACVARLNAIVAQLYQLSAAEFEHVLDTFPLIPKAERDAALGAFSSL
jgi:hypothetical protein